jgi:hypothetical protein
MNPNVATTSMNIQGREFVLAEVSRGRGQIGVFRSTSTSLTATDVLFIEKEPIIKMFNPRTSDDFSNKLIAQISGAEKAADFIKTRLAGAADNYYNYSQGLVRSAIPVLELLCPGLYVVHESQMHPCDGNGGFFWNSYNQQREVNGTSEKNTVIGDNNYTPCFLIPTKQTASFQAKIMYSLADKYKDEGKQLAGVAYHVTGMFSALLEGHHAATAAILNDADFRCIVIEPITGVIYDSNEKSTLKVRNRKVVALSCPYVNIPLEQLPDNTLERFLITRNNVKPVFYQEIKPKMTKTIRAISKRAFPANLYEKVEQLPDCALVESASGVNAITEEQLTALLAGEVMLNDEYIVSNNHYSSIIAAANYLQTADFKRFLSFAVDILKNDDISVAHKYIAERLLAVMHPEIFKYFSEFVAKSGERGIKDGVILETAHKYLKQWEEYAQRKQLSDEEHRARGRKKSDTAQAIADVSGIATLEAAVRNIGEIHKEDG